MKTINTQSIIIGSLSLSISDDFAGAEVDWRAFEKVAVGTLYQSFAWCAAWNETVGRDQNIKPIIVIARTNDGEIEFLLPLQIRCRFGVLFLEWQTHPHGNYGFGLFSKSFHGVARDWFTANAATVWNHLPRFDVLHLEAMPAQWAGLSNPFEHCFNLKGANASYLITLQSDYESLYHAKRGKESRRSIRKRDNKLAEAGVVKFGLPDCTNEAHAVIAEMFKHQEQRLAESGIYGVFGAAEQTFIHRYLDLANSTDAVVRPYTLWLDGRILSVILCAVHGEVCSAMITSLAAGPERKFSPGDVTLRGVISASCADGLSKLDLSTGEWDYKLAWADDILQLHICLRSMGWRGIPAVMALGSWYLLKRFIKETPAIKSALYTLRSLRRKKPQEI